jgi:aspartyl-tRNA(Asn)/glutamyl-tRNA(Gln) amidotransferase subunit B
MREEKYEPVIGLETHVELSTNTKMFCGCRTSFGEEPNTNTCPVCLGLPGSLPVTNKKAVEYAIKIAVALDCRILDCTIFHRKNYFYPDMSKNYQISQYDRPLGINGHIDINMGTYVRRVRITRVHMEEDTGKLIHTGTTGRISESEHSIADFNRAGTPLIEIVTEPDMKSPEEARQYLMSLRDLLLYLDVSDCSMEEGSLRCDANVSVMPKGSSKFGTRAEIKNLNSFKFLYKGLEYEIKRHINLLEKGKRVLQQTRHYDSNTETTKAMRQKEEAHDYRYFPDPDLLPLYIDESWREEVERSIPELPGQKIERFKKEYMLSDYDCAFLASDALTAAYFEEACSFCSNIKSVCNWIMGDFAAFLKRDSKGIFESKVLPRDLARLIELIDSQTINVKIAKDVFEEMYLSGRGPDDIIKEKGLEQISDQKALEKVVAEVIASNEPAVNEYRAGKKKAIGFLVGQVMAKTKGKANPKLVNEMIINKIKGPENE